MNRFTFILFVLLFTLQSMAQTNLELAEQAIKNGDYSAAIESATKQIAASPKDANAYMLRAVAYSGVSEYGKSLTDFSNCIKYWNKKCDYSIAQIYQLRASVYVEIEDYRSALDDYNTAIKKDKKNPLAYAARARFFYRLESYENADADYQTAYKLNMANSEYAIEVARCRMALDKIDDAVAILENTIRFEPNNAEARRLYAVTCLYKGDYRSLIDNYVLYLGQEHGDIDLLLVACSEEFSYGLKAVTAHVAAAKDKDVDEYNYWLGIRARVYQIKDQYRDALNDLAVMESLYADTVAVPFVWYQSANCYDELYEYDNEIKVLTKLIKYMRSTGTEDAYIYRRRAGAYDGNGQYELSIADYTMSIEVDETDALSFLFRGIEKGYVKDFDGAMADYNKAILLDENLALPYIFRGQIYLQNHKDTTRAKSDFTRVLELDTVASSGSVRHYALAYLHREQESIDWMNQLLSIDTDDEDQVYDAACLYGVMGKTKEALNYLSKAFEMGYRNFNHVAVDKNLDSIRETEEFKNIIAKYKKERIQNIFNRL